MGLPIFLGGGGRVARLAISCWEAERPWVMGRRPAPDLDQAWPMERPPPQLRIEGSVIVNFAGVTPRSSEALERNTDLAIAGLSAARAWGIGHVMVMSSSAVYGDTGPDPAREDRALAPLNAYGAAKAAMEDAVLRAAAQADAPAVTILRLANVAGAGQPFDAASQARSAPVRLHRFADGRGPSRSYVGPQTLARSLAALCDLAAQGKTLPQVLNLAAPSPTEMEAILDALGQPVEWIPAPGEAVQHVHLDVQELAKLCPDLPEDGGRAQTLVSQARAATEGAIR